MIELTPRQAEIARCLERGLSNKAIARELGIALGTVKRHVESVLLRLGAKNRRQAAILNNNNALPPPESER